MSAYLLRNLGAIVRADRRPPDRLAGAALADLPLLPAAWLLVENGCIADYGPMATCPERADEVVDAKGQWLFPGWVDSHTHLVFAGSREGEFEDRIRGLSYEAISARGGGILNSARRLEQAGEAELLAGAHHRLQAIAAQGTVAVEIKSGYGLSYAGELKMLRVIRQLKEESNLAIKATFLGAHALPLAYRQDREAYLRLLIDELLPVIAGEGLADYIDVFCEKVAFTAAETDRLLTAGAKHGLRPKIHTNQFNSLGGIETALAHNAVSVDHLEVLTPEEIDLLAGSATIATLLPTAPFFLRDPYPPARALVDAGACVALASDYNPGSSPSGRMPFVVSLGCIACRLTPAEAINAATINGAAALEWSDTYGSITPGRPAAFFLTAPLPSLAYLPYAFGSKLIEYSTSSGRTPPGPVLRENPR